MMKLQTFLPASMLALAAWILPMTAATADTLYDSTSLVKGQQSFVQSFSVATPGTLTVTLTDVPWLDTLSGLNCFISTASGVLGSAMGEGTESMDITAGTVYAHWFGSAQGAYNLGVMGVKIEFEPSASAVPLPTSFILLLSGLGLLFGWQNRRPSSATQLHAAA
jgi:hypothetical protein